MPDTLTRLERTIRARKGAAPDASYTAQLLAKGNDKVTAKFCEEAVELALASSHAFKDQIVHEAADTLFHLLVLLAAHDIALGDVLGELERREGVSGLEEKASRN